jgi:formylglycine-generating enzyme required for sulfatase activity
MTRALFLASVMITCAVRGGEESQPQRRDGKAADPLTATDAAGADDPMLGKEAGQERDDNALVMKLVWCPPGAVTMEDAVLTPEPVFLDLDVDPENDAPDAIVKLNIEPRRAAHGKTVHAFLTKGYWLGKYEVTQSEWRGLMKTEPWKGQETTREGAEFPATYVDWNDASAFCRKLTGQERAAGRLPDGWEYVLPSEAQWERACRARSETRFSFGDDDSKLGEFGWFIGNTSAAGEDYPHRVGQKKPNAWGLCDMHGNVWEWCRDSYRSKLAGGRDPEVRDEGPERVLRGGGIYRNPSDCRSGYRNKHAPTWRLFDLGFRVALCRSI